MNRLVFASNAETSSYYPHFWNLLAIIFLSILTTKIQAEIIEANYTFDGERLSLKNGADIFSVEFTTGDTLELRFSAEGEGAYWDFSDQKSRYYAGFDIGFEERAFRGIEGSYEFYHQGKVVHSRKHYYSAETGQYGGPGVVNAQEIDQFDAVRISYKLTVSLADNDTLIHHDGVQTSWSIWDSLGNSERSIRYSNGKAEKTNLPKLLIIFGIAIFLLLLTKRTQTLPAQI